MCVCREDQSHQVVTLAISPNPGTRERRFVISDVRLSKSIEDHALR